MLYDYMTAVYSKVSRLEKKRKWDPLWSAIGGIAGGIFAIITYFEFLEHLWEKACR